jgi:dTMP kinase
MTLPFYVVIEGPDGVGKSSAALHAEIQLRAHGYAVVRTREPSDGVIGTRIRRILQGDAPRPAPIDLARLYAEDRMDHVARVVLPALRAGAIVLQDRGLLSSIAYQHGAVGIPLATVRSLNRFAPQPDVTIVLAASEATCAERRRLRRGNPELFDTTDAQRKARAIYGQVYALLQERVHTIDAEQAPDVVANDVTRRILQAMQPMEAEHYVDRAIVNAAQSKETSS